MFFSLCHTASHSFYYRHNSCLKSLGLKSLGLKPQNFQSQGIFWVIEEFYNLGWGIPNSFSFAHHHAATNTSPIMAIYSIQLI